MNILYNAYDKKMDIYNNVYDKGVSDDLIFDIGNLAFWYDFSTDDYINFAIGNSVSYIYDKSGSGNHLSQGSASHQSYYYTNVRNGHGSLKFLGIAYYDRYGNSITSNVNFTFFCVVQSAIFVTTAFIIALDNTMYKYFESNVSSGTTFRVYAGDKTSYDSFPLAGFDTSFHISGVKFTSTTATLYLDSADTGALVRNFSTATSPSRIRLGVRYGSSATRWDGYMSDLIAFQKTLNDAEIATVKRYLSLKWGSPL